MLVSRFLKLRALTFRASVGKGTIVNIILSTYSMQFSLIL